MREPEREGGKERERKKERERGRAGERVKLEWPTSWECFLTL